MKVIFSKRITTISSSEFIVITNIDELINLIHQTLVFELILDLEHESAKALKKFVCAVTNTNNVVHCVTLPCLNFDICNLPFVRRGEVVKSFSELLITTSRMV